MTKKKRLSQFELLRIMAMFLIVQAHSIGHGVLDISPSIQITHPLSTSISLTLGLGGIGVYIFVLISGYFLIDSHIKFEKVIRFWLPIFFWSIILFVSIGVPNNCFSIKNLIKSMFPILFNQYWFMTVYFVMYISVPLLNVVVKWLDSKKKIIYFMILGLIAFLGESPFLLGGPTQIGARIVTFYFIYCIGGLIRKYKLLQNKSIVKKSNRSLLYLFGIEIFLIFILTFVSAHMRYTSLLSLARDLAFSPWTLFLVMEAIGIFIWLGSKSISYNPVINKIASTTFGIYLISDNNYLRNILWKNILHMNIVIYKNPLIIIIYIFVSSVIVFIISSCLEYLRKIIFQKFELYLAMKTNNWQKLFKV